MKKIKLKIFLIVLLLGAFCIVEKRSFYYSRDKTACITIWKMLGGKCLIIPGRYMGLWTPNQEYLETTNRNGLTILWDKKVANQVIIFNSYGLHVDLNFKTYKVKYYGANERDDFINEYYVDKKVNPDFEYLTVDIGENLVVLNGKKM